MSLVLLLGGVRSGKSAFAVEMGRQFGGDVIFVATAEGRDEEMAARIARHRRDRPPEWTLVEEPLDVGAVRALGEDDGLVIVDCLTLWVANLIERQRSDDEILAAATGLADRARHRRGPVVVVSNEVGLGVVSASALGRRFRDLQGSVNRIVGAKARRVFFVVAGRALELSPGAGVAAALPDD
jgi:adenosylcobinamide kinase / adenosylcobinamide-phosphate guanylyltransferase